MKTFILSTNPNNAAATISRVTLGVVLFAHGAQKLLGWFDGFGFKGTMAYFTQTEGLPWIIGFLVIIIEFFGSLSLVIGFGTRIWSFSMAILMLGIIRTVFWNNGFFMNWFGNKKAEGYEYFLLMIGLAVSVVISGAGKYSIDSLLLRKKRKEAISKVSIRDQEAALG